jgi:glycosyltransferase involved in cell wall biosynthesis
MSFNPKVTVAIPVYNVEAHVAKCLNSVINQTYDNIEILIVYDSSDDNSLQVTMDTIVSSKFPFRIIKKNELDKGIGKSRNVVLDNLTGDYLFFVDSDDSIDSHTISLMVNEAKLNNADIVAASHRFVDEQGKIVNVFKNGEKFQYDEKKIFDNSSFKNYVYVENGYFSVYSWNKLYKTIFLKDNNLRYIHNVVEDAVFSFLEIRHATKIVLLPDITLDYLVRNTSITNALMYKNMSLEIAKIYISIRDFEYSINDPKIFEDVCSNIDVFHFCYTMIVRDSYKSKKIAEQDKFELCKKAFITPNIAWNSFLALLLAKKKSFILLLMIKMLPFRLNMMIVNFYHRFRNV